MVEIGFGQYYPFVIWIFSFLDRNELIRDGMGEGACAEVHISTVIRRNHVQAELQRFCHTQPKPLTSMQGNEGVATAIEREDTVAIQVLFDDGDSCV